MNYSVRDVKSYTDGESHDDVQHDFNDLKY